MATNRTTCTRNAYISATRLSHGLWSLTAITENARRSPVGDRPSVAFKFKLTHLLDSQNTDEQTLVPVLTSPILGHHTLSYDMTPPADQSLLPPPAHPSLRSTHSSPPAYKARRTLPPALPARQQVIDASSKLAEETPAIIAPPGSFEPSTLPEVEEELSEVQLRELYDDEEIDRFLHLFSAVSGHAWIY